MIEQDFSYFIDFWGMFEFSSFFERCYFGLQYKYLCYIDQIPVTVLTYNTIVINNQTISLGLLNLMRLIT